MNPNKLDIQIIRGSDFELELITQNKTYAYDPDHVDYQKPADYKRTHAENLEYHGFTYTYIDFFTDYVSALFDVKAAWAKSGNQVSDSLLQLTKGAGLTLTSRSVIIRLDAAATRALEFDSGKYELLLTSAVDGSVDQLVNGDIKVVGEKE